MKSEKLMIEKINKVYPNAGATPISEFYDEPKRKGIWFKYSEYSDAGNDAPLFDDYRDSWADTGGVNPKFNTFMEENGWMCEPYDAGTLMAYFKGGR